MMHYINDLYDLLASITSFLTLLNDEGSFTSDSFQSQVNHERIAENNWSHNPSISKLSVNTLDSPPPRKLN